MAAEEEKSIHEVLSLPILLADRVIKSFHEAQSFKPENSDLARQVTHLSQLLRSAARLISSSSAVYDRPIRRVSIDLTKTLDRALTLARKCRHKKTNVLHHVLSITTAADFKKVSNLIDNSLADMKWVLSIFNQDSENHGAINLSLPPIASTDPMLAWIWSYIAAVHSGRAEAAHELANLAQGNERNKMIIVKENGIPPLLNMLRESTHLDAQSAAASALCNLADDQARVMAIADGLGVQVIGKALNEAPMKVQVTLANLVSKMSEMDLNVQDEFGRENVTRRLVTLLGMDVDLAEFKEINPKKTVHSLHSLVEINKEMTKKNEGGSIFSHYNHSYKKQMKEREIESPEVKLILKVSSSNALWKLAKGSLLNSRKITETKALLVLARIIETEENKELKMNCLMVVMELAAVAEKNDDIKRASFKPTSTAAKVVLDQLLRVTNQESSSSLLKPAIKAIGCLASMFPAKEKRIVQALVLHLDGKNSEVSNEAVKALGKFVCEENYNRKEHSKAMIEFDGVVKLMSLLRSNELCLNEVVLLCNLAINAGNSKVLERARVLSVLQERARNVLSHNPELRDLFAMAIHHLTIYQAGGVHVHRHG
ncbi:hypothetical protein CASFOL_038392 [Castilleja foliolosa]|uniref:DUF7792 domain-containing protein n=1 Tax=Castilleja foliolosa TaxID=1961234 RepID=A0ABD3BM33_9LAMI